MIRDKKITFRVSESEYKEIHEKKKVDLKHYQSILEGFC